MVIREAIYVKDYSNIYTIFSIRSQLGLVSDIKVEGKIKSRGAIYFHDMDLDGQLEIWSITRYQDTLRLNLADFFSVKESYPIIPVDPNYSLAFEDYFIEIIGVYQDMLFFGINAGYPLTPRAVYSFNLETKAFNRTKDAGSLVLNPFLFDLDLDGTPEIVTRSFAPENIHYKVPYTDSSAWLRVFDLDLNHFFEPIEYKHNTSTIMVLPLETDSGNFLCVSHRYGGQKNVMHGISLVDKEGNVAIKQENENMRVLFPHDGKLFISDYDNKAILEMNEHLQIKKKLIDTEDPFVIHVYQGPFLRNKEYPFLSYTGDKVYVLPRDFSSEASYSFEDAIDEVVQVDPNTVYVRSGGKKYILDYGKHDTKKSWLIFGGAILMQLGFGLIYLKRNQKNPEITERDYIIFKTGDQRLKVKFDDIEYLEAAGGPYTNVYLSTQERPLLIVKNIGAIEKELPERFVRVSRKNVIDLEKVMSINSKAKTLIIHSSSGEAKFNVSKEKVSTLQSWIS